MIHLTPHQFALLFLAFLAMPLAQIQSPHATTLPENQPQLGHAGTIVWKHHKTHPIAQSCGGTLEPESLVIFHPTLPCGSQVWLLNPETGTGTLAVVASNRVMFETGSHRMADMSPGTAKALDLDPESPTTSIISLQPVPEGADALAIMATDMPAKLPKLSPKPIASTELSAATKNGWAEANMEGTEGMAAVLFVTKNRARLDKFKENTIAAVVHAPYQFSWTHLPNPSSRFPGAGAYGHGRYKAWQYDAKKILTDRHSGQLLGLQYALSRAATHFYAPKLMQSAPKWTRSPKMATIALPKNLETKLGHKFYAYVEVIASENQITPDTTTKQIAFK